MDKNRTIIVIGAGKILSAALIEEIQHSHGIDVDVISYDQANEKEIIPNGTSVIPHQVFDLKIVPRFEMPKIFYDKNQAKNDCKKGWRNKNVY